MSLSIITCVSTLVHLDYRMFETASIRLDDVKKIEFKNLLGEKRSYSVSSLHIQ